MNACRSWSTDLASMRPAEARRTGRIEFSILTICCFDQRIENLNIANGPDRWYKIVQRTKNERHSRKKRMNEWSTKKNVEAQLNQRM